MPAAVLPSVCSGTVGGSRLAREEPLAWTRRAAVACAVMATCGGLVGPALLPVQRAAAVSTSYQRAEGRRTQQPGALPPANWIIKSNDLAELEATGADVGSFQYVACGEPTDPLQCVPGQIPIYTNFNTFQNAVEGGLRGTVLIDYETWSYTPRQQVAHPDEFIRRTQQLVTQAEAQGQDIVTIETPGGNRTESQLIDEEVTAARYGSPIVEIQSQFAIGHPQARFRPFVARAIRDIRKVSKSVEILVGLATDAGGTPVTAREMVRAYDIALQRHAQGFWLNSAQWAPPRGKGCAPEGCPQTAVEFLVDIGAVGR